MKHEGLTSSAFGSGLFPSSSFGSWGTAALFVSAVCPVFLLLNGNSLQINGSAALISCCIFVFHGHLSATWATRVWGAIHFLGPLCWSLWLGFCVSRGDLDSLVQRDRSVRSVVRINYFMIGVAHAAIPYRSLQWKITVSLTGVAILLVSNSIVFHYRLGDASLVLLPVINVCLPGVGGFLAFLWFASHWASVFRQTSGVTQSGESAESAGVAAAPPSPSRVLSLLWRRLLLHAHPYGALLKEALHRPSWFASHWASAFGQTTRAAQSVESAESAGVAAAPPSPSRVLSLRWWRLQQARPYVALLIEALDRPSTYILIAVVCFSGTYLIASIVLIR